MANMSKEPIAIQEGYYIKLTLKRLLDKHNSKIVYIPPKKIYNLIPKGHKVGK